MGKYERGLRQSLEEIKNNKVYIESIGKDIGNKRSYDFMICKIDTCEPILRAGIFLYDSEKDALDAGKTLVLRTQQQGQLEEITAA